jgi:uncharacterized membrane-anchored protein YitT (DUF2179 family)
MATGSKTAIRVAQFAAGGGLTVLATWLSETYGPSVGALIWVFPILLYVAVIGMAVGGESTPKMAAFCYASFPTTLVNAVSIVVLAWLITAFPGKLWAALAASIAICLAVGFAIRRFQ